MPDTADPLAEVVSLLQPRPSVSKLVEGAGRWLIERRDLSTPFYCAVVEGSLRLLLPGAEPRLLVAGDFVLMPVVSGFATTSAEPPPNGAPRLPTEIATGCYHVGDRDASVTSRVLIGHCDFDTPDRALLLALLPDLILIRDQQRLTTLVSLIHDETRADRAARDRVLVRLLEVLLIEALRASPAPDASPGLLRALADPQLARALRMIHADPAAPHSVTELARAAGLSRSSFCDRFRRETGAAPMAYVTDWRLALARGMLAEGRLPLAEIARRVGYGSARAFSMAFSRHAGLPPGAFAQVSARAEAQAETPAPLASADSFP